MLLPHGLKTPLATPLASPLALAKREQVVECNAHACYVEARARTCDATCECLRSVRMLWRGGVK